MRPDSKLEKKEGRRVMRSKNIALVTLVALLSSILAGCISFPAIEKFVPPDGVAPTFSVNNKTSMVGTMAAYDKKVAEFYPNGTLYDKNCARPVPTQIPIVVLFHDSNNNYLGVFARVLNLGPGAQSTSWTIGEEDVVYFGERLRRPDHSAPPYEPSSEEISLPWTTNMEAWAQVPNDTPNELLVKRNGKIHVRIASGALWAQRMETVYPGARTQPIHIEIFGYTSEGEQLGIAEFWLAPQNDGVSAMQFVVSPNTLRY